MEKGHEKETDITVRSASRRLAMNSCKIFKDLEFEGHDYIYSQSCENCGKRRRFLLKERFAEESFMWTVNIAF